jgi:hypothetical protein
MATRAAQSRTASLDIEEHLSINRDGRGRSMQPG